MKYFTIILFQLVTFSILANLQNEKVPYERKDSEHLKEIFVAWNDTKGEYLYESIASIVMHEQQPERPSDFNQTPFELLQSMDEYRIKRMSRIASSELMNERKTSRSDQYYWEEWLNYLNTTQCDMNRDGKSSGDPHMRTFDGESYDFQNAGDYLLTSSEDNSFMIQTQQVRTSPSIALNGEVAMNINGDLVTFSSVEKNSEEKMIHINGQEIQNEQSNLVLPQGGVVEYNKSYYLVKWPTGEQMRISKRNFKKQSLFDLNVYVPACRQDYYGLLGNNDNQRNDIFAYDQETNEEFTRDLTQFSDEEIFGDRRNDSEVLSRVNDEAFFISRSFGRVHQLDSTNSLMRTPMTNIPDSVRYPKESLSLAELDDEQIREGLIKAKKAGVAEEDLFGAVYDYGHLGLEPVALPDSYEEPRSVDSGIEPKIDQERDEKNKVNPEIRINPSVFIGVGGRVSPPKKRRPSTMNKPVPVRSGGTVKRR